MGGPRSPGLPSFGQLLGAVLPDGLQHPEPGFALGSLISGLLYGAKHWLSPLWKRFAVGMVALAVGVALFVFVTSLPMLAVVMFVTGFAIAPTLINGNNLVQLLVPPSQLTEGLTWVGTALGVGVSIGTSVGGQRIDAAGAHAGFEIVLVAGALSVLVTLASLWTLRRRTTGANHEPQAA